MSRTASTDDGDEQPARLGTLTGQAHAQAEVQRSRVEPAPALQRGMLPRNLPVAPGVRCLPPPARDDHRQRNTGRSVELACQELVQVLEHLTAGESTPGRPLLDRGGTQRAEVDPEGDERSTGEWTTRRGAGERGTGSPGSRSPAQCPGVPYDDHRVLRGIERPQELSHVRFLQAHTALGGPLVVHVQPDAAAPVDAERPCPVER